MFLAKEFGGFVGGGELLNQHNGFSKHIDSICNTQKLSIKSSFQLNDGDMNFFQFAFGLQTRF